MSVGIEDFEATERPVIVAEASWGGAGGGAERQPGGRRAGRARWSGSSRQH